MAGKFAIVVMGFLSDGFVSTCESLVNFSVVIAFYTISSETSDICFSRFGRRFVALLCLVGSFLSRAVTAVAPNFATFVVGRFFVAVFALGSYTALYVLGTISSCS